MEENRTGILTYVQDAATIAIAGHVRPDGDCVGSCLALYHYLKQHTDAEVAVYLEQPGRKLSQLPGAEAICVALPEEIPAVDVFFVLDCGDVERLGFAQELYQKAAKTVCIDHHVTNTAFAEETILVPSASSTCELLYEQMEEERISQETAECLYTGILHDTGVFHHSCTSPRTMEIAGRLMAKGIDFPRMIDEGFYQRTYIQNQILGRCLMESMLLWGGLGIVSYLTRDVMEFYGVTPYDLDGVIDQLRLTAGVEVAIFLYETEEGQSYKVSMRSNGDLDVSKVALYFGGGGHVKAAGCTMKGSVYDVINNLTEQLDHQLVTLGKLS